MMKNWKSFISVLLSMVLLLALSLPATAMSDEDPLSIDDSGSPSGDGDEAIEEEQEELEEGKDEEELDEDQVEANEGDKRANKRARKGLTNALSRVRNERARQVLSDLLDLEKEQIDEERDTIEETAQETSELEEALEALVEAAEDGSDGKDLESIAVKLRERINSTPSLKQREKLLERLTEVYDRIGNLEESIATQGQAVRADLRNIESYRKLARLYDAQGRRGIKTFVNGDQPEFDVPPVLKSGRTLVPFRAISSALGARVQWNPVDNTITVARGDVTVTLTVGSNTAIVNGEDVLLDSPPEVIGGRTLVPVRTIAQAFGATVQWDPESESVIIYE